MPLVFVARANRPTGKFRSLARRDTSGTKSIQHSRSHQGQMPSKLDFLSKYTSKDTKQNKKKKSKKEKKREDDDFLPELPANDQEDEEEELGDGPVVVDTVTSHNEFNGSSLIRSSHRHDTSSEEDKESGSRRRHDSPPSLSDDEKPRRQHANPKPARRRHDYSDTDNAKQVRRRHGSSDDDSSVSDKKVRRRHDSSDEDKVDRKSKRYKHERHDSSSSSSEDGDEVRMSSGHVAGLQKGRDFARKESKIQSKRHDEAQEMVDKYGIGETVYRDKTKRADAKIKKKPLTEEEKLQLHTGRAQLEQAALAQQEFQKIKESTFARRSDDAELEDLRKNEIRPDDPMAAYAVRQKLSTTGNATNTNATRPIYKGPPPKPNRFHIPPGHRWDAVDRGNGFEDRLLAKRSISQHQREQEYRNSAADM